MAHRSRAHRAHHIDQSSYPSSSSAYTGAASSSTYSHPSQAGYLEQENDSHVNLLGNKVSELKQISLAIGEEVQYQNRMMNAMENEFDKAGSLLGNTMKRLQILTRTQNGRWMWYLILFVLCVVAYIYFFRFR
ncbi:hypothetical protein BC832DRAFT_233875 [Gaertneriomyces semiglobifer]|nr:hypothetical protein BC832DRAFT_233875 [Gaertneriomyces semiglobifer]